MEYNTDRLITTATIIVLVMLVGMGAKIVFSNGTDATGNKLVTVTKTIDDQISNMNVQDEKDSLYDFSYNDQTKEAMLVYVKPTYWQTADAKKELTSRDDVVNVTLPSKIKHNGTIYKVTSTGSNPLNLPATTKSVTYPEGYTKIGAANFYNNQSLEKVSLPSTLIEIGDVAFSGNKITSINLPNGLQVIGQNAFDSNSLTSVNLPDSLKEIRPGAFTNNKITSAAIPKDANIWYGQQFDANVTVTKK